MTEAQTILEDLNKPQYLAQILGESVVENFRHQPENIRNKMNLNSVDYIKECRTIGLVVPRRSGKSEFLRDLHRRESSILFVSRVNGQRSNRTNNIFEFQEITSLALRFRGNPPDQPFKYFLVDDSATLRGDNEYDFWQFVGFLHASNYLAPDFFIVKMTT